jgi:hypothetical protein
MDELLEGFRRLTAAVDKKDLPAALAAIEYLDGPIDIEVSCQAGSLLGAQISWGIKRSLERSVRRLIEGP